MTKPSLDDRIAAVRAEIVDIELGIAYARENYRYARAEEDIADDEARIAMLRAVLATLQQHGRAMKVVAAARLWKASRRDPEISNFQDAEENLIDALAALDAADVTKPKET